MSNLISFSLLNQKVEKIRLEEGRDTKGLAFEILCLKTLLRLNDDEIEESITDGSMDGEVDAIYIANRCIHLLTFKYTDNFELTKNNYPEKELDQFILTIDSIISGSLDKKTINLAVWEKYQEIRNLADNGKIDFYVYVVSNQEYPVEHAKIKLDSLKTKYQLLNPPIYLNQDDLVSRILEAKTEKVNGNIRFIEREHFEKSEGNIKTVIGAIAALDLINLVKDPKDPKLINEFIFNENVRVYKPEHRVNKAIIETAIDKDNFQFFYLNNGITILCDKVDYTPNTRSPYVQLSNLQIINGGQTTHSLFEVFKSTPERIDTIDILVRVCEISSEDPISQKISKTTNNQIPIGNRDLHSNDSIQIKLEEDFSTLGYFYERKPNQHIDKPKNKVLDNELLGQLFLSYHLGMPSEAKNNKVKVFSDLYDQIYNENLLSAAELLRLYNLYLPLLDRKRKIQNKKRRGEVVDDKEAFVSRATFHILYGVKLILDKEFERQEVGKKSFTDASTIRSDIQKSRAEEFTQLSINLIYEVVENEISLNQVLYSHDKFFKEIPTNSLIKTHIQKRLSGDAELLTKKNRFYVV